MRIAQKDAQLEAQKEKRRQFLIRSTRNKILKRYKELGVKARKEERHRVQKVKELAHGRVGNSLIPIELQEPIPDLEKALTEEAIKLELREALITLPEFSGVVIPDSTLSTESTNQLDQLDPQLDALLDPVESQQDYIGFDNRSDNVKEEDIQFGRY